MPAIATSTASTQRPYLSQRRGGGPRQILFGGEELGSPLADLGILVLRVVAGLSLALGHGMGKVPPSEGFVGRVGEMGFPLPELFAWLAGSAEFGGALLLAVGLLTRPAAFLVAGSMVVVALIAHAGDPFSDREKAVLFLGMALCCLLVGAGRYSVDALLRRGQPV